MRAPEFVTLTGLDAHVDLGRVEALSAIYPVEWGVLFSSKLQGEGRYPPLPTVEAILSRPLRLAAHVCGRLARTVVETGDCPDLRGILTGRIGRLQVNTPRNGVDTRRIADFAGSLRAGTRAILQSRDPETFPADDNLDWLYDRSGGNGVLPERWPVPTGAAMVGYAGGLGADNVGAALGAIAATHPQGTPYWIDMETRIRTDDRLDLDLCEAVLRQAYPDAEGAAR